MKLSLFLYLLRDDGDNPETEEDAGPADESEIPEPEEHVDLLVDYVDGQNAECIVTFNVAGRSELVEGALGHPGENVNNWIHAVFFVAHGERNDFNAKCEECPI